MNKRTQEWAHMMAAQTRDGYYVSVANLEQSARAEFLKKVYTWFFVGVLTMIGSAAAGYLVLQKILFPDPNGPISEQGASIFRVGWIAAIVIWMFSSFAFRRMLLVREKATFALFGYNILLGIVVSFMATVAMFKTNGDATILWTALGLTGLVFAGLTATVMFTKGDFSFLKGILSVGFMLALGVVVISILDVSFGWGIFSGSFWSYGIPIFFVLLLSSSILYTTSEILHRFPEDMYVSAAAMLSIDFGVLLYYILMILSSRR